MLNIWSFHSKVIALTHTHSRPTTIRGWQRTTEVDRGWHI